MKKVKSRILKIRNFKNIGLSKKDNEYQELYLDSYWDDKIVGNLIILIGENNIGKSNVLKSINMIQDTKEWEKKNSSDSDNDEFQKELSNILENNRPNSPDYNDNSLIELIDEKKYSYSVNFENEKYEVKIEPNPNKIYDTKNIEKIKKLLEKYYNLAESIIEKISEDEDKFEDKDKNEAEKYKNSFYRKLNLIEIDDFTELEIEYSKMQTQITQFIHFYNRIIRADKKIRKEIFYDIDNIKKSKIKELLIKYYDLAEDMIEKISEYEDKNEAEKFKKSFHKKLNSIDKIDDFEKLKKKYGKLQKQITQFINFYNRIVRVDENKEIQEEIFFNIEQTIPEEIDISSKIPNIVFYKRINLSAEDLTILNVQVNNETKFFTPLLNKIKVEIEKIKDIHSLNENQIKSFENSINNAIKPIFEQINKLATKVFGKNEYDFKIELDKEKIKLSMKINNEATTLLQQSEGFRWFFEFFFQFYFIYDLQAGDIILIDEPDAHLSIPSVKGLRNIIKKIAKEMGVTFVTTTHNPFFVDIDYFDEIRIVKKKKDGDGVEIVRFGDIDTHTEADTLKEIIDAFGLENLNRDIITNPNNKVIFVEGITDYNYLTAFKLLYNRKNDNEKLNLLFLPIAGLGQNKEESKNKIKILSKFKDVIQLTDEDEKANEFKEKMKVIKLTEIDENFKEIEYLFSENDKEKFKYIIKNKSFEISSLFKNIIFDLDEELEEETINNFNKVLVRLNEISQNLSDI